MPSARTLLLSALAAALLSGCGASARYVTLGGVCSTTVDEFGCEGTNYLECIENRWTIQNICAELCTSIPSYYANCGRNSHGLEPETTDTPAVTSSPVISSLATSTPVTPNVATTSTSQPAAAVTTVSTQLIPASVLVPASGSAASATNSPVSPVNGTGTLPSASIQAPSISEKGSGSSIPKGVIIGPIVAGVALIVAVAATVVVSRRKNRFKGKPVSRDIAGPEAGYLTQNTPPVFSDGGGMINVSSVLTKRYICAHPYMPVAADEIALNVGDAVRLNLLFNDGWAKGSNETTGQHGLLPCACVREDTLPTSAQESKAT
ncbi:hypothetical protein HKX48_001809 [Thoreauomyces humboldtii]|nr:hypothetical protein HKX48_001809 [Thoreauomyces humboldtii]